MKGVMKVLAAHTRSVVRARDAARKIHDLHPHHAPVVKGFVEEASRSVLMGFLVGSMPV